MKYKPKISIIVAVYNGANTLSRCITSILSQTYSNSELIIMDGGSTDDSVNIIKQNSKLITYWESKYDKGIYHAWNKALSHVKGEWICFLGSDDFLYSNDVLEKIIPHFEIAKTNNINLVYGSAVMHYPKKNIYVPLSIPWSGKAGLNKHQVPVHPGLFHNIKIFQEHGLFDEHFKIAGDYELLLRELKRNDALFIPDLTTTCIQHGGISCNIRKFPLLVYEDILARRKNGLQLLNIKILGMYIRGLYSAIFN